VAAVETRDGLSVEGEAVREQAGFEIDGEQYEIPRLDTITLDEERVLYIYADTVLQDFAPAHPEAPEEEQAAVDRAQYRRVRNPDFKRALAHIAYRRRHPDVSDAEVQVAIGKANALEVDIALIRGGDDSPPATSSQKQPESRSDTNGHSKHGASGRDTARSSARADATPEHTGTTGSDTSSPGAAPTGSES
jgi:hypothetical protein